MDDIERMSAPIYLITYKLYEYHCSQKRYYSPISPYMIIICRLLSVMPLSSTKNKNVHLHTFGIDSDNWWTATATEEMKYQFINGQYIIIKHILCWKRKIQNLSTIVRLKLFPLPLLPMNLGDFYNILSQWYNSNILR